MFLTKRKKSSVVTSDSSKLLQDIVAACRAGALQRLIEILKQVPEKELGRVLNEYDTYGDTALTSAASNGHVRIIEYLLKISDVDLNKSTQRTQFTALKLAAAHGYENIVDILLQHQD